MKGFLSGLKLDCGQARQMWLHCNGYSGRILQASNLISYNAVALHWYALINQFLSKHHMMQVSQLSKGQQAIICLEALELPQDVSIYLKEGT